MAYCDTCERYFNSYSGLWKHLLHSSMHNFCASCERDFPTYQALIQHYVNSSLHNYCKWCDEDFGRVSDLNEHYDEEHGLCKGCNTVCTLILCFFNGYMYHFLVLLGVSL